MLFMSFCECLVLNFIFAGAKVLIFYYMYCVFFCIYSNLLPLQAK